MYRVEKVLNHNTVIGIRSGDNQEFLMIGKGIGFGKKVTEQIDPGPKVTLYSLQKSTERGNARELVKSISPECLEIAGQILDAAEQEFGKIDRNILFPMADHIEYAVKRVREHEQISNPLTADIRALFHLEYKTAKQIIPILKERMDIQIDEDEVGYIALHIRAGRMDEKLEESLQMITVMRMVALMVEESLGIKLDPHSFMFERFMAHLRYLVARIRDGEAISLDMDKYARTQFPESYALAERICARLGEELHRQVPREAVGHLGIHIERLKV